MNAQTAATQLFQGQMAGFAHELCKTIKAEFPQQVDPQKLDELVKEFCASQQLDLSVLQKSAKKAGSSKPRQRKVIPPECLCQARVWATGKGTDQCSLSASNEGLCTKHHKIVA